MKTTVPRYTTVRYDANITSRLPAAAATTVINCPGGALPQWHRVHDGVTLYLWDGKCRKAEMEGARESRCTHVSIGLS